MSFLNIKLRGNINRIRELDDLGQRPDAIKKTFKEHGIEVTEGFINCVLSGEIDELDRRSLPKKIVKDLKIEKDSIVQCMSVSCS